MQTRRLGDLDVSAIGLGGMPLSRPGRAGTAPERDQAIATVHAALDLGVTLIDTADCYAPDHTGLGHNEELVAEALRGRSEDVAVATKGGIRRDGSAWPVDGRPEWIKEAVRGSLRRLRREQIDLYQHWPCWVERRVLEGQGRRAAGSSRYVAESSLPTPCTPW